MIVGIIGLGLIGGSFGLSLKKNIQNVKVVGLDINKENEKIAKERSLVDEIVSFEEIQKSDVIILSIPVESIIQTLKNLDSISSDTTIIDLGSTKEKIINTTPEYLRKNLVAAHPMAGIEKFGPNAAFDSLYKDQVVVLCDIEDSGEIQKKRSIDIFNKIGMKIHFMGSKEHDIHAAYISHLPHAISYALANSVMKQEDPESILLLAAGGFRGMSRIAKSSPSMWSDIFSQNRDNLLESVDNFLEEMQIVKKLIEENKEEELKAWMLSATKLHEIL
jgi:prephenate dehydrogenase